MKRSTLVKMPESHRLEPLAYLSVTNEPAVFRACYFPKVK